MSRCWLVVLALLFVAAAASAQDHPAVAEDHRWLPLDPGNRWTYVVARERTRTIDRGEPIVERLRGTRTDEIVGAAPQYGPQAIELRSVLQGRSEGDPADTVEKRRDFVVTDGTRLRIVAREAQHALREDPELVRFAPPLEPVRGELPAGTSWPVGIQRADGVTTETEGEVLGVQDAQTPVGLFEKCLVLRRTGAARGKLEVYGDEIELREGKVVTTEWYAPGVGLVLAKVETEQTIVLENGSVVEFSELTQLALTKTERASAPAAPAPAADATSRVPDTAQARPPASPAPDPIPAAASPAPDPIPAAASPAPDPIPADATAEPAPAEASDPAPSERAPTEPDPTAASTNSAPVVDTPAETVAAEAAPDATPPQSAPEATAVEAPVP